MTHAGGRPLKFQSVEELDSAENGLIEFPSSLLTTLDFKKEKEIEEFLVLNMQKFVESILEDELISFEADKPIFNQHFGPRGRRIDLFIIGKKKIYIIELKRPSCGTESRAAIGQLLDYGREYLDSKKDLIILTTKFDINTARTIKVYGLPIRYIYIDKKRFLEYSGHE